MPREGGLQLVACQFLDEGIGNKEGAREGKKQDASLFVCVPIYVLDT